jgi:uncharacterized protein with HXXEE motif
MPDGMKERRTDAPSSGPVTVPSGSRERIATTFFVALAGAVMLVAMGPAVVVLVIALGVSLLLWLSRSAWPPPQRVMPIYAAAVIVQCVHLAEEYATGFYRTFPAVMGSAPWSATRFLAFNVAWLVAFVLAGLGIARGWRPAYVVALFLALGGGIGNGLGHLALAIGAGGYVPGAYTAPLVLLAGGALTARLLRGAPSATVG